MLRFLVPRLKLSISLYEEDFERDIMATKNAQRTRFSSNRSWVRLFCNIHAAMHIAANPILHESTKHVKSVCDAVLNAVVDGTISTIHVRTNDQLADL